MTTALALTPNPATGSCLLQITGAPVPSANLYTQGTGVDGWAASNGTIAAGVAYTGAVGFLLHANSLDGSDFATATKTISGLTIGTKYRMTAWFKRGANSAEASVGVSGIGVTTAVTATSTWQQVEYIFTATATSHTLQVFTRGNSGFDTQGDVYWDDIKLDAVASTFGPTTITRTDINGSRPVRLQPGQEPISGSMTVTDYEGALKGLIRYDLVDSAGVTTSASTTLSGSAHSVVNRVNLATNPSGEVDASGWGPGFSGATITRDTTKAWIGSASIKGAWVTGTNGGQIYLTVNGLEVGQVYSFAIRVFVPSGSPDVQADAFFIALGTSTSLKDQWVTLTHTFTATSASQQLGITTITTSTTAGQSAYVDGLLLLKSSTPPTDYFDGATPNTAAADYQWVGTANASQSRELVAYTNGTKPILHVPVLPQLRAVLDFVMGYSARRDATSILHRVIGRSDPIDVGGPLATRQGTLTIWAPSHSVANSIAAIADSGEVLMLRQADHAGMDLYFTPRSVQINPDEQTATGTRWNVAIDYAEVAVPSDSLLGAVSWTYASVSGGYANYSAVKSAFASYSALVVGP